MDRPRREGKGCSCDGTSGTDVLRHVERHAGTESWEGVRVRVRVRVTLPLRIILHTSLYHRLARNPNRIGRSPGSESRSPGVQEGGEGVRVRVTTRVNLEHPSLIV